jgi:hypothetical protein
VWTSRGHLHLADQGTAVGKAVLVAPLYTVALYTVAQVVLGGCQCRMCRGRNHEYQGRTWLEHGSMFLWCGAI